MKKLYEILAIIIGYGLIIMGFVLFGENLKLNIMILDIIMACFIFTQFVEFILVPMINLGQKAHKEVAMMGIHYTAIYLSSLISIIIIIGGIVYDIAFKYQLLTQIAVIFLFLMGRLATLHAGDKAQNIYDKEHKLFSGKEMVTKEFDELLDYVSDAKVPDQNLLSQLNAIRDSLRYITPSGNTEAQRLEKAFCDKIYDIKVLLRDYSHNEENIATAIEALKITLAKRKKY